MKSKYEIIIDESKIEQIKEKFFRYKRNEVKASRLQNNRASVTSVDHVDSAEEQNIQDTTVRTEIADLRQHNKLKIECVLCLLTLILQIAIFYDPDCKIDLFLDSISLLTFTIIAIQLFYLEFKVNTAIKALIRSLIILLHPNTITEQMNGYLHMIMPIRILIVIEYLFKSNLLYSARSQRMLDVCNLEGKGLFMFTVKSCLNSFRVTSIIAIYVLTIVFFSHLVVIASACEGMTPYPFETSFEIVGTIFTTVGYGEFNNLETVPKRIIITLALCIGILSNSFVTLMSLSRLLMDSQQINSYKVGKLLQIRGTIALSSARFLHKTLLKKTANKSEKSQLYKEFQRDIIKHKNYIKSLNRKGIIEFLTCSFRSNLDILGKRQKILNNLLYAVLKKLKPQKKTRI